MSDTSSFRRKGFVLLSVLMLATMLISAATAFAWFARTQARSVAGKRRALEYKTYSHVLVNSIVSLITTLSEHSDYDSPSQKWYQPIALQFEDETCIVRLTPLDGKIPLRNLFLPDGNTIRTEFKDIWEDLWEKIASKQLGEIVLDLMDKNDKARVGSVDSSSWLNRPVNSLGELLILSHDITPEIIDKLGDYVSVWSEGHINLNTAPLNVLELLPGLDTYGLAERIAAWRVEHPLSSLDDVARIPGANAKTASRLNNIAGVKSRYCEVEITFEDGTTRAVIDKETRKIMEWEEL